MRRRWVAQLQFFQGKELKINFNKPIASGNFGSVFYGSLPDGRQVSMSCMQLCEYRCRRSSTGLDQSKGRFIISFFNLQFFMRNVVVYRELIVEINYKTQKSK